MKRYSVTVSNSCVGDLADFDTEAECHEQIAEYKAEDADLDLLAGEPLDPYLYAIRDNDADEIIWAD